MPLMVFNRTAAPVTLAAGNPARVIPISAAPPARGPGVNVTSELRGLTGGQYAAIDVQRAAGSIVLEWTDGVAEYATAGLTVTGPVVASSVILGNSVTYVNPIAADLISVVAAATPVADAASAVIANSIDCPRKLQVHMVIDTTHAITAGSVALVGVGPNGEAVTETVSCIAAVSGTVITTKAYSKLTSATLSNPFTMTGGAGGTTVGIGVAAALAVPTCVGASAFGCDTAYVAGVREAVGTVDATYHTITPTTPADAAKTFTFGYHFTAALA